MDKKSGSALLTALFIMTLVAIAATSMSARLQFDIYRAQLLFKTKQLYLTSQLGPYWAMDFLAKKNPSFHYSTHDEAIATLPTDLQKQPMGIEIKGQLYDLQARFNINNLQQLAFDQVFSSLFKQLFPTSSSAEVKTLIENMENWLIPYHPDRGFNPQNKYYAALSPPYTPSHQPLHNLSELRLIKGVTSTYYQRLQPFVTALPDITPINPYTASKPVLMSLSKNLKEEQIEKWLVMRQSQSAKTTNHLLLLIDAAQIPSERITLESQYFLCITDVSNTENHLQRYTLLKRQKSKNGLSIKLIQDSFNTI